MSNIMKLDSFPPCSSITFSIQRFDDRVICCGAQGVNVAVVIIRRDYRKGSELRPRQAEIPEHRAEIVDKEKTL